MTRDERSGTDWGMANLSLATAIVRFQDFHDEISKAGYIADAERVKPMIRLLEKAYAGLHQAMADSEKGSR